jgi:hypothetical protein
VADGARIERAHLRLRHSLLPELEAADLLAWDREAASVSLEDDAPVDDGLLRPAVGPGAADRSEVFGALADERRVLALAVLAADDGPMSPPDLAAAVAVREGSTEDATGRVHSVGVSLHHVHLPKLTEAGLVSRDESGAVTYEGHPILDAALPSVDVTREARPSAGD